MWHWKRQTVLGASALAFLASSAVAQFPTTTDTETFDTFSLGQLDGQGNWNGWDGNPTSFANVVNTEFRSAPQSAELAGGSDSVNDSFAGMYTSGTWTAETWAYLPSGFVGKSYFITMNSYVDGGPYEWNGQIGFNGTTGRVECDCGTTTTTDRPLVFDAWVDLRLEFDFDNDNVDVYYNSANEATPIASYPISGGVFGQDNFLMIRLQAIDLYPDAITYPNVTPMYFDDISIKPGSGGPPGTALCFGDGTAGTPCPCGNPGDATGGCNNSLASGGAVLAGSGAASLGGDTLILTATRTPNQPGIFFQGDNNTGPVPVFGDGLRCCGTNVLRLGTWLPAGNTTNTDTGNHLNGNLPPISDVGANATNLDAGETRCYQWWYRDPAGPCGADFNTSNALSVTWSA